MSDVELQIPGYQVLGVIGEGGMGTVYRARQLSLDRLVAIKVLRPHIAQDAAFTAQFIQEARAAAKLTHPNIVQAIEAGQHEGTWFFVMELVEGGSLHDRLVRDTKLPETEALQISTQVAQALDYAWRRAGIVHRDIKPANILLTQDGQAKVADLGLARRPGMPTKEEGFAEGTPQYCAPEQCRGEAALDTRTDLYALGATLYHMLCGRPPFDGDDPAKVMGMQIHNEVETPRKINPSVSLALESVVVRLLAKDPAKRFQDPAQLLEELHRLQALRSGRSRTAELLALMRLDQRVKAERALVTAAIPARPRRWRAVAALALVVAVCGTALLVDRQYGLFRPARPTPAPAKAARGALATKAVTPPRPLPPPAPATSVVAQVSPEPVRPLLAPENTNAPPSQPRWGAQLSKLVADVAALQQQNKFDEAEALLRNGTNDFAAMPSILKQIEAQFAELQTARAAYNKKLADEAAAKAAAEQARLQQLDAQARAATAAADALARQFLLERAQQQLGPVIAQTQDADVRARIQARGEELQLLGGLKSRLLAVIGQGLLPACKLLLRSGGVINGRPAQADAETLNIAVGTGAGTIALRWSDIAEPTIYELLQRSVTARDGAGLAAMALYGWETNRAKDAKHYHDLARAALGEANLPAPVKRRAGPQ